MKKKGFYNILELRVFSIRECQCIDELFVCWGVCRLTADIPPPPTPCVLSRLADYLGDNEKQDKHTRYGVRISGGAHCLPS